MCIQPENMLFSLSDPADSPAVFWEGSFVSRTFALSFECRMKDAMHETDRFESQRSKKKSEANGLKTRAWRPLKRHPLVVHVCKLRAAIWNNV